MIGEEMIVACCTDLAGKVRGKAFPPSQFDKRLRRGVGWTPTNVQITCFDVIAESPFGALGDLVLLPDEAARVRVDFADGEPRRAFCARRHQPHRRTAVGACTRSILKAALDRLHDVAGLTLLGAFEHEFQFRDRPAPARGRLYDGRFPGRAALAETLIAAARAAGLEPDTFMKEYGPAQYEVTMAPVRGVAIADQSTILRELVRAAAGRLDRRVTFTPIRDPVSVGNGVHLHLSFLDGDRPATYDPQGKHGLSEPAGQFVAGILKYLELDPRRHRA